MHLNLLLLEGMNGKLKRFLGSKALFRSDFRVQRVIFSRGLKLFYATREERGWKGSFFRGGVISRNIAPVFRYSSLRMEFECATPESKRLSLSLGGREREREGAGKLNAVNRDPVNRPFPCQEVRQAARLMGLMIHRGLTSWININYDVFLCKRPCKWDTSAPRRGLYILCYIYIYIHGVWPRRRVDAERWWISRHPSLFAHLSSLESVQTQFDRASRRASTD